jgi:preprotein translocase subunit SecD
MEVNKLAKEWRMWVLAITLVVSFVMLAPEPLDADNDGTWDTYTLEGLNGSLGIDFTGGSQLTLRVENNDSKEMTQRVATTLQSRINNLGLGGTDLAVRNIGGEWRIGVTTPETNQSRVEDLIAQEGAFEATMPFIFQDSANFSLDETYRFERLNDTVKVSKYDNGELTTLGTMNESDSLQAGGTKIRYSGSYQGYSMIEVVVYDNQDIDSVDISNSAVRQSGTNSYRAVIPLIVTQESEDRMQQVANNFEVSAGSLVMVNSQNTNLTIYIDDEKIREFTVSSDFQRGEISQPTINLDGTDEGDLRQRMNRVEGLLQSGRLPEPVKVVSSERISSTIGTQFMAASVISIIGSLIAVGIIIFLRYRNPKLALPIVLTGASEVFILLGAWFTNFATLNLSAIAGIIAAVGTGVDDQIIITDESETESIKDWSARMKTAFFVIFTSAASTIGAMTPVLSPQFSTLMVGVAGLGLLGYSRYSSEASNHYIAVGIIAMIVAAVAYQFPLTPLEQIQEFATTTIVGIMVGIAITRPAFAKVLESIEK